MRQRAAAPFTVGARELAYSHRERQLYFAYGGGVPPQAATLALVNSLTLTGGVSCTSLTAA